MPYYWPLLLLLTFVSLCSVWLDRRYTRPPAVLPEAPAPSSAETISGFLTGLLSRLFQAWTQRFGSKPDLPDDPVRDWLATVFVENPAERAWFASLTPEQFKALRSDLTAFCANLGFDLVWLVEQASFKPAALEETGKAIVSHYCQAVRAAVLAHEEMEAVQRYHAFLANPSQKENLAFGQQLYSRLVEEKLAPPAAPELLMAEEKERQSFAVTAIQSAAQQHGEAFGQVLKRVGLSDPPMQNAPAATSAPAQPVGAPAASRL